MSSPSISVVLPVYNGADFIESAIRSLLAQDVDLEIIVSDDCSRDGTLEIIRSIASPVLHVITNAINGGQFVNFNRAIARARGEYIQCFSHDDIAHPGFLESQIKAFAKGDNVGLVYASCNIIDGKGAFQARIDDDGTPELIDFQTYLKISSLHGALPPSISSIMVRASVFARAGSFDESYAVAGDLEFFNRVAAKYELARNRSLLLDVRVHGGSVTQNPNSPLRYMREEARIVPFYRRHMDGDAYREVLAWRLRNRGADHAKTILRLLQHGQWRKCGEAWRALAQVHSVPLCIFFALRHTLAGRR